MELTDWLSLATPLGSGNGALVRSGTAKSPPVCAQTPSLDSTDINTHCTTYSSAWKLRRMFKMQGSRQGRPKKKEWTRLYNLWAETQVYEARIQDGNA